MTSPLKLWSWISVIVANAIPIIGAATGELTFFQVLYLYWFESFLLIIFQCIKIAFAKGRISYNLWSFTTINGLVIPQDKIYKDGDVRYKILQPVSAYQKVLLIFKMIFFRSGILLFYGIFLFAFILFQVTDQDKLQQATGSIFFQDAYFNSSVLFFLMSMITQLFSGFYFNGAFKRLSPRNFYSIFDARTILLHVCIIGAVFIHKFLFEGKSYAAVGEIVYVSLFIVIKAFVELMSLKSVGIEGENKAEPIYI